MAKSRSSRVSIEPMENRLLFSTTQPAHLVINPVWDSSITSLSTASSVESGIKSAIGVFDSEVSTPITVTIKFTAVSSGLAQSVKPITEISYSTYRSVLSSHATSSNDKTALADDIPTGNTNPLNGNPNMYLTFPNARALGLSATSSDGLDGTIGLNVSILNFNRTSVSPSKYDLRSVVSHEIDEVLSFGSALNGSSNGSPASGGPIWGMDLFRFDQNQLRSYDTNMSSQAYFSIDAGVTRWARFNQTAGADFSDWYSPGGQNPQVQDAFGTAGSTPNLGIELNALDVLGYSLASGVNGGVLPDLQPALPSGWSGSLVTSTSSGSTTNASAINTNQTVYVDAAVTNWGEAATKSAYETDIVLDGVTRFKLSDAAGRNVNSSFLSKGLNLGKLSAGSHTLTMKIDVAGTVKEISEANNSISRTFTVTSLPSIGSLTLSSTSVAEGTSTTLTANNVQAPGSSVASVAFYRESNSSSGLQTGTGGDTLLSTDTTSPYSATVSTSGLTPGNYVFYAIVTDKLGRKSSAASTTLTVTAAPGAIAGTVFSDTNASGTMNTAEAGLANVTIYIDTTHKGSFVSGDESVLTDSRGNFRLPNLAPGIYRLAEVVPANHLETAPALKYFDVRVYSGKTSIGNSFADAPTAIISGTVFNDANGDGKIDNGELGLGLWTVYLDMNNDGNLDSGDITTHTDANGNWHFSNLLARKYTIITVQNSGTTATKPTAGLAYITLPGGINSTGNLFGEKAN